MPAKSKVQQKAMAIAAHDPSKLYKKNRDLLRMANSQLHDFAATKTSRLPEHTKKKKEDE